MPDKIDRFFKIIIWAGLGLVLFTPLVISNQFYFPFIYPKAAAFKLAVEVIFIAFLLSAWRLKETSFKFNRSTLFFGLFLTSAFVSAFFGVNFYRSFWSNMERQEGLILLIHLLLFLFVLVNFLKDKKSWLVLFDISVGVSAIVSLYALGQYLGLNFLIDAGGARLSATLGNASYLAGYLIFNMLFATYLWFERREIIVAKFYYPVTIALGFFILLHTGTRGGFIAAGVAVLAILVFFLFRASKKIKAAAGVGLVGLLIFVGAIFVFRDSQIISNLDSLKRLTKISLNERTAQTRLMTWQIAWQGFEEKPLLGYGYENFNFVFNKYFRPDFYEDAGSVIWFDRAHNVFFDRLVAGGAIGLTLYLIFILYPLAFLLKRKIPQLENEEQNSFWQSFTKLIFGLVIVAYIIQNLFVFDHLTTFISLLIAIAFIDFLSGQKIYTFRQQSSQAIKSIALFSSVIIILPLFYFGLFRPTLANWHALRALDLENRAIPAEVVAEYQKAISYNTFGNQEFRIIYSNYVTNNFSADNNLEFWRQTIADVRSELLEQVAEQPENVVNYLLLMRFNNATRSIDRSYLSENFDLFEKAVELSKDRPHVYYEIGYTQLYLAGYYQAQENLVIANGFYQDAINSFGHALSLAPKVTEANTAYIMALINAGRIDQAVDHLNFMDQEGIYYRTESDLLAMANTAIFFQQYELVRFFYQKLVEIAPNNPQYLVNLALAYANLGQNEAAIATAEQAKTFGGGFVAGAEAFIQDVRAGKYR